MNFKKLALLLLLNVFTVYADEVVCIDNNESSNFTQSSITVRYYPEDTFQNKDDIFDYVYSVLLFAHQEMGYCTMHFCMGSIIDNGEIIEHSPYLFNYVYAKDPIFFCIKWDKIHDIIVLEFITDKYFPRNKIALYCSGYVNGICTEVETI